MESTKEIVLRKAMYRRWIYMVVAIVATVLMPLKPVFSFQEDKGIIYVRSFEMDQKEFHVIQTELATGIRQVTEVMSVKGLYYCYKIMLWGTILALLCFFTRRGRVFICTMVMLVCAAYYVFMIVYALRMSDTYFATLYPNIMSVLPAIVLQMMLLTRHNVIESGIDEADEF